MTLDYDLLDEAHLRDPYGLYEALRSRGRAHYSSSLGGWVLTHHRDVEEGLTHRELSAARFSPQLDRLQDAEREDDLRLYESLARWFTFADPPYHTRMRTFTRKVFSGPMKRMQAPVERLADELLEPFADAGGGDVIGELARPLSVGAIAELLGVPRADYGRFTAWSDVLADFIGGALHVPDRRQRAITGLRELEEYLGELTRARRSTPTEDLIGGLAAIGDPDGPTDDEIVATAAMVLFAGHGTTTNLLGNGVLALLRHPEQLDRLRRDPGRIPAAIEELLRYDSPVQLQVRIAVCDGAMGLEGVRAGDRVFLVLGSANRDPEVYERPDRLDLGRKGTRHLTFGYGIHFCLGAPLARIEAPALLARLLERAPQLRLDVPDDELRWQPTVGFRGLQRLPVAA